MEKSKKDFAFVTLVMLGDNYVPGALALGYSLRKAFEEAKDSVGETEHLTHPKLVVMVSECVSEKGRSAMRNFYDEVVQVEIIEAQARQAGVQGGMRNGDLYTWINKSFTKYNCLKLTQYEKVIFLDADMVALSDPSVLFEIEPPAGVCSAIRTEYNKGQEEDDKYHGKLLPSDLVREAIYTSYGMRGCMTLLKPSEKDFKTVIQMLYDNGDGYGDQYGDAFLGADERLISDLHMDKWKHIHHKFAWTSFWATEGDAPTPVMMHYVTVNPWTDRAKEEYFQDYRIWDVLVHRLAKDYPELEEWMNLGELKYPGDLEVPSLTQLHKERVSPDLVIAWIEWKKKKEGERGEKSKMRLDDAYYYYMYEYDHYYDDDYDDYSYYNYGYEYDNSDHTDAADTGNAVETGDAADTGNVVENGDGADTGNVVEMGDGADVEGDATMMDGGDATGTTESAEHLSECHGDYDAGAGDHGDNDYDVDEYDIDEYNEEEVHAVLDAIADSVAWEHRPNRRRRRRRNTWPSANNADPSQPGNESLEVACEAKQEEPKPSTNVLQHTKEVELAEPMIIEERGQLRGRTEASHQPSNGSHQASNKSHQTSNGHHQTSNGHHQASNGSQPDMQSGCGKLLPEVRKRVEEVSMPVKKAKLNM